MAHGIYRVVGVEIVRSYTLRVTFDDGTEQVIDFGPVLKGALYGLLRDERVFNQVAIDPEVHTLVWPNGADFDPETLYDWPKYAESMRRLVEQQTMMSASYR